MVTAKNRYINNKLEKTKILPPKPQTFCFFVECFPKMSFDSFYSNMIIFNIQGDSGKKSEINSFVIF